MSELDWSWELSEGYSRLVEGTRIQMVLEGGAWLSQLDVSPVGLLRRTRPLELVGRLRDSYRAGGSAGLKWKLTPEARIRCRVLFEKQAFLGNFRVPSGHCAVEWDLEGKVESAIRVSGLMAEVSAGSRIRHSWVQILPTQKPAREVVVSAWKAFVDPLEPSQVAELSPMQVIRLSWRGAAGLRLDMGWRLERGVAVPTRSGWSELLDARLGYAAGLNVRAEVEVRGEFQLQLSRRSGDLNVSLRRSVRREAASVIRVGVSRVSRLRVRGGQAVLSPVLSKLVGPVAGPATTRVNRQLRKALSRKLEAALALSVKRGSQCKNVIRAVWKDPDSTRIEQDYAAVLKGVLPSGRDGFRVGGTLETLRNREFAVRINLLDWVRLERTTRTESWKRISATPSGELLVEQGALRRRKSQAWGDIELLELMVRDAGGGIHKDQTIVLRRGWHGRSTHRQLARRLQQGLHCGILGEFELPARGNFPRQIQLWYHTSIGEEGIEKIRSAGGEHLWAMTVKAMQLAFPDRYRTGSARDWIESPDLRTLIDRDPSQAHLESLYPIAGRTEAERRIVIKDYRRARKMFGLLQAWGGERREILDIYRAGLDVPFFVLLHLLCPATLRRSAALMTGDLQAAWGLVELIDQEFG